MSGFESKKAAATDKISITEQQLFEIIIRALKDLSKQVEDLSSRVSRAEQNQRWKND